MKILMLSTDPRIFEEGSEVRRRMIRYGELFDKLHIIVLAGRKFKVQSSKFKVGENVWAYPTNSRSKLLSLWDGYQIAKKIITNYPASAEASAGRQLPLTDFVITSQDPFETGLLARLLLMQFPTVPFQVQVHTDFLSPWFARESLKNRIRVWIAKRVIPRADRVRVVSSRIAESIMREFPDFPKEKITVLPIIIPGMYFSTSPEKSLRDLGASSKDKTFYSSSDPPTGGESRNTNIVRARYAMYDTIILMASRLTREKDISMAIEAMRRLTQIKTQMNADKVLLLIVGEGPEFHRLKVLSSKFEVAKNVIFAPWTNDLAPYFAAADIFALSSRYEGYGRTIVEAMRAGVPVVMTDVGVAGELVRDEKEGLIVPVRDEAQFSRALMRLVEDTSLREKMGKAGMARVQEMPSEKEWFTRFRESFVFKPKLIYAVPRMERGDATHFAYLPRFAEALAKEYDLAVFSESELAARNLFSRVRKTTRAMHAWRKKRYRIAYVHYSFLTAWCAKRAGLAVYYWNCGEPWKYRRSWFREWFERRVYHTIDYLVTGTEGLADRYAQEYDIRRERIKVIANWIELDSRLRGNDKRESPEKLKEQLHILEGAKAILFVHRLSKRKGAHYLPEIMRELRDENVVLLIAGEGPESENVKLQFTNYQLQNRVRLLGAVPNYQLPNYYLLSDVFLMPSDEEGFPHVLLEAMATGLPYMATKVGGVKEITPPGLKKYLAKQGDVAGISRSVRNLLKLSPSERQGLQKEMTAWVTRYDLPHVIAQFKNVLGDKRH